MHRRTINELVKGKRSISADMALRLGKFTNTTPQMWLNLQNALDLWDAYQEAEQQSRVLIALKLIRRIHRWVAKKRQIVPLKY